MPLLLPINPLSQFLRALKRNNRPWFQHHRCPDQVRRLSVTKSRWKREKPVPHSLRGILSPLSGISYYLI